MTGNDLKQCLNEEDLIFEYICARNVRLADQICISVVYHIYCCV